MDTSMSADSNSEDVRSSAESSEGFTFGSVNALRRNLTETFDQQVQQQQHQQQQQQQQQQLCQQRQQQQQQQVHHTSSEVLSISDRIHQYEQATTAPSSKPPLIPSRNLQANNFVPTDGFAIYLRVRPPAVYKDSTTSKHNNSKKRKITTENSTNENISNNNTIEILQPENPQQNPTTVRTYPPADSNTSKFNLQRNVHGPTSSTCAVKEFDFHQVLAPKTTQQDLYTVVAAPLIQSLFEATSAPPETASRPANLDQKSALLFSYGVTNAGKTHTILGNTKSDQDHTKWGIIPRAISDILDRIKLASTETGKSSDLYVSCFEVYNEQIFDLLPSKSAAARIGPPPVLKVRESRGQILVRGLVKHNISSVGQGVDLTNAANSRRHTFSNNLNAGSSRSHFICQMQIIPSSKHVNNEVSSSRTSPPKSGYSTDEEAGWAQTKNISTVWIVDLAGSERAKRTGMGSSRQKEASLINKSLLTLMRCLTIMRESGRQKSANVIPFRESKLTLLFMRHLMGSSASRTSMVVNVNPSIADFDETQHVLAYASKAKTIQLKPEELNKKRKQYFGDEYDMDGRKKSKTIEMGKKFFSKAVKGLSPKKIANRLSPKKWLGDEGKNHHEATTAHSEAKQLPQAPPVDSNLKAELASKEEKIRSLMVTLRAAKLEIETLDKENSNLIEDLQDQERQIRTEVSEEMEERFKATRARNLQELERLKSKLIANPSLCRSTRKAQMDKADSQIQDLLDKVEECEEEMVRLRQEHSDEVVTLKARIQEPETRKTVRFDDQSLEQLAQLKKDLAASQKQVKSLEKSKSELIENYEKLLQEEGDEDSEGEEDDAEEEEDSDTENRVPSAFPRRNGGISASDSRRPLAMKNTMMTSHNKKCDGTSLKEERRRLPTKNSIPKSTNNGRHPASRAPVGW
jgi:hypothetical protein